jgi:NADH:ubiquinone oxidoreductase subunit 5 (subunit L)/multisubunit Na+/H+ antiporter MnhA subunit
MSVEGEISLLGSFLSLETVIFAAVLIPAGLLVYATYFKNYSVMNAVRSASNPLAKLLKHGYFFDDLYENVTAKAVMAFSRGVKFVEVVAFNIFPVVLANSVIRFAGGVHKYLDTAADNLLTVVAGRTESGASTVKTLDTVADKLLDVISRRTLRSASKARRTSPNSLQHYLAAAIIGFIMLVILIIISIGV